MPNTSVCSQEATVDSEVTNHHDALTVERTSHRKVVAAVKMTVLSTDEVAGMMLNMGGGKWGSVGWISV